MTTATLMPALHGGSTSWKLDPQRDIVVSQPAGVMGIINATPDSFSDGGQHNTVQSAVAAGQAMVAAGATWLDVGGESSRPGAEPVAAEVEIERVIPIIAGLRAIGITVPISVDTTKGMVAAEALAAGASAINDISAGRDPALLAVAAKYDCPLILMHMQGDPANMQVAPAYEDVVGEVIEHLQAAIARAITAGVEREALMVDPGIGFGKTLSHNVELLQSLSRITEETGRPLLLGISRKSFIAKLLGADVKPTERDAASHVLHALLASQCALVRVHDVPGAVAAMRLQRALHGRGHDGLL